MKHEELIRFSIENLYHKNTIRFPISWIMLLFFVLFILFSLPIIQVDINSQAPGLIRPYQENKPIYSYSPGKIKRIPILNNQYVEKGDLLVELESDLINNQSDIQWQLLNQCLGFQMDLRELIQNKNPHLETIEFQQDFYHYSLQLKEFENKIAALNTQFVRQDKLFKEHVIPQTEWEKMEFELNQAKDLLNSFAQNKKRAWSFELQKEIEKEKTIRNTLQKIQIEEENLNIFAPQSGTIIQNIGLKSGNFLPSGIEIAKISSNDSLIVETYISPKDIGHIHLGQKQKIHLESFNFRQWGFLEAEVIEIDRNLIQENNAYLFKVRSKLIKKELSLKNGTKVTAQKGMTLNAHFFLTKRTLFQLFTDKADDWFNPNQTKNNGIHKNKTT